MAGKWALIISVLAVSCHSLSTSKAEQKLQIDGLVHAATESDSLGHLKTSIKYYTEILKLDSLKLIALVNRGRAYVYSGELQRGIDDYNKAIKYYPDANTYYARGMAYIVAAEYSNAFNDFIAATLYDPKFGEAYYGLSLVKLYDGQLNFASDFCKKADSLSYNEVFSKYIQAEILKKKAVQDTSDSYR